MIEINAEELLRKKSVLSCQGRDFDICAQRVGEKIELNAFDSEDRKFAKEIALIIAEVFTLPPDVYIRVERMNIPACQVAEVYDRLTHEHVVTVIEHFKALDYEVKSVKTYLRTALYNSVFELENRLDNEFNARG